MVQKGGSGGEPPVPVRGTRGRMATRRLLVVEGRRERVLLIKRLLLDLESWVEVRWVRDLVEAREAIESDPGIDLVLISGPEEGGDLDGLRAVLRVRESPARLARLVTRPSEAARRRSRSEGVTLLELPPSAAEVQALLDGPPPGVGPRVRTPIEA